MDFTKAWTMINLLLDEIVELQRENGDLKREIEHMKRDTTEDTTEEEI